MLKFLKMVNEKKNISSIDKPSELHISTRSAKCSLSHKINMAKVVEIIKNIIEKNESKTIVGLKYKDICVGEIKKNKKKKAQFYNQVTILIKPFKDHKNVNVKFF